MELTEIQLATPDRQRCLPFVHAVTFLLNRRKYRNFQNSSILNLMLRMRLHREAHIVWKDYLPGVHIYRDYPAPILRLNSYASYF